MLALLDDAERQRHACREYEGTKRQNQELSCPKCKGVVAAQAANARGKRKASCCVCGYRFKVVKAARSE
jgi:hypothetical protein